jgi:hypothetical protein
MRLQEPWPLAARRGLARQHTKHDGVMVASKMLLTRSPYQPAR